jgi:hypothetical protein
VAQQQETYLISHSSRIEKAIRKPQNAIFYFVAGPKKTLSIHKITFKCFCTKKLVFAKRIQLFRHHFRWKISLILLFFAPFTFTKAI